MLKEKVYDLNGHQLLVSFEEQLIRIKNPKALQKFLSTDIDRRSIVFVNYIKQDYFLLTGKELNIKNNSLIIEIWGHVYANYCARAMKNLIKLKLIANAADFIIKRSDTIDCGEREVDGNRKFWDLLAKLKRIILKFLPKGMK